MTGQKRWNVDFVFGKLPREKESGGNIRYGRLWWRQRNGEKRWFFRLLMLVREFWDGGNSGCYGG